MGILISGTFHNMGLRENGFFNMSKKKHIEEIRSKRSRKSKLECVSRSERKKAEETLRDSEEKYRSIFENAQEIIITLDLKGNITDINKLVEKYGFKREELIGKNHFDFIPDQYRAQAFEDFEKTLRGGIDEGEIELCTPRGNIILEYKQNPIKSGEEIGGVQIITTDITERKQAEDELRLHSEIMRNMVEGIILTRVNDATIVYANSNFEEMFDYNPGELIGKNISIINAPTDKSPEAIARDIQERLRENGVWRGEVYNIKKDGTPFWCYANVSLFNHPHYGEVWVATHTNITERKKAEEAMHASEAQLSNAMKIAKLGYWEYDVGKDLFMFNDQFYRIFRTTSEQVGGYMMSSARYAQLFLYPDDSKSFYQEIRRAVETTDPHYSRQLEHRIIYTNGETGHIAVRYFIVKDKQGRTIKTYGANQDITERKKTEEKLRESEERFKQVAESAGDWIWEVNAEGLYTYSSPVAERILGYKPEEIVGKKHFYDFFVPHEKEVLKKAAFEVFASKKSFKDFINTNVHKNGSIVILETTGRPIIDNKGNLLGYRGADKDITERKRAEETLRASEDKYRAIFEQAADSIVLFDAKTGIIIDFNNKAQEKLGYSREEFQKLRLSDIDAIESKEEVRKHVDIVVSMGMDTFETKHKTKSGEIRDILVNAKVLHINNRNIIQAIWNDITERKQAEEKLIRLNKMLKMLTSINQDMLQIKDRLELLQKICERIIEYAYKLVWIGFCNDRTKRVIPEVQAGFEEGYLNSIKITYDETRYGKGPTGIAIKTGRPKVMRFIAKNDSYKPWRKETLKRGYRSSAAIPIFSGGKVIGALNVYADKEDAFSNEEIKLLDELAHNISIGLRGIDEEIRRKQAEKKLLDHRARLKSLTSELTLTEERERRHIAVELHDRIAQSLVISKIKLDKLHSSASSKDFTKEINEIRNSLYQTIQDIRSLTFDLSYPILYELGFEAAVAAWLVEQIQEKYGVTTEFEDDKQPKPMGKDVRVLLFRAVRELLINVVKHANASKVKVTIRRVDSRIQVNVEDDGIGFDVDKVVLSSAKNGGGFGFFSIRERLEDLAGILKIDSKPGRGTKVTLIAPLTEQNTKGKQE